MSGTNFTLTAEFLRRFLSYDPASGFFTWKVDKARAKAGHVAGSISAANGYIYIGIGGGNFGAHRLAFLYCNGFMPLGFVDHIDGNKANNRFANLRDVPNKVNCENRKRPQRDNKVGLLGVTAAGVRFGASIKHNGKKIWIGTFDTGEEAHAAYLDRKRAIHAGCTL